MDLKINNTLNRLIAEIKTSSDVDDTFRTSLTKLMKAFEGGASDKFTAMFRQKNEMTEGQQQQEAIAKAKWDTDPSIRAEFGEFETWVSYFVPDPGFKVKTIGGQTKTDKILI